MTAEDAWFSGAGPEDEDTLAERIREGSAGEPQEWPAIAVDEGFVDDETSYYEVLRTATVEAATRAVQDRETADDQQLIHAVRAMDDCESTANELAERVSEWASSQLEETGAGFEYVEAVAARESDDDAEQQLIELAQQTVRLREQADSHRRFVERTAPAVAPNLAALAGPILAARLIGLAGSLEAMAKLPSSTVQVLGAEDALFAHLRSGADPPKHGIIFTHEYVNGTDPDERGSAARALAGKLTIAGRIDHYGDGYRPELEAELDERIDRIRSRGGDGQ